MIYKNLSRATKTFYGVTFKPGEVHEVPGYINCTKFVRCSSEKLPANSAEADETSESVTEKMTPKRTARTKNSKEEVIDNGTDCNK